ncbi:unnamed protein product [Fraxinus pennsylvanica]|uniref:Fungal lipase-type domain-containing protein n=1 Tax=Fraxinus pennsylvanica TaxID=56036 RepID=A0AAD1YLQ6_9LAMI|nr:unnamed protein product [Fraxinus pennsylvanica]
MSSISGFLIVKPENGGIWDLFKFLAMNNQQSVAKFLEGSHGNGGVFEEEVNSDNRWVIVVSIIARKVVKMFGKPLEWTGYLVEFILNLLSLNGNFLGLAYRILHGDVVIPQRGSETFISAVGHLDGRIDLYKSDMLLKDFNEPDILNNLLKPEKGNQALLDLCIMASKLAYENAKVVRNVVNLHWKMHFVDFYNCWNGKVHMGFLESLGLGTRKNTSTFQENLQVKNVNSGNLNGLYASNPSSEDYKLSTSNQQGGLDQSSDKKLLLVMGERTAYYFVKSKLKSLLKEHKNAKFVVTGHSLGGALAILFPTVLILHEEDEVMQWLLGVYTYGQLRVGNRQLGRFMESRLEYPDPKYFRVVYCNDIVPRLPYDNKTFLYKHFGICLYYNSLYIEHKVDEEPNPNYFGIRFLIPEYMNVVWELFRSLIIGHMHGLEYKECWESTLLRIVGLAIPGLSAHSPVDYVNSVRLGRMDQFR